MQLGTLPIERQGKNGMIVGLDLFCNNCKKEYFVDDGSYHCGRNDCDYDICKDCVDEAKKAQN